MKVLFLDDMNMFEGYNPRAYLINIGNTDINLIKSVEKDLYRPNRSVFWEEISRQGGFNFKLISQGKKSNYKIEDYDVEYKLISGNY